MGWLAELFETNRIIVLSVYGQVFFVMGLVFWYGARLVSFQEISPFHFFVTLMVRIELSNYLYILLTS